MAGPALPLLDARARKKPVRSASGVAVVAVMSSPAACPHGKCTFCPGGPEVDAPQSYTGFEPSTMRARRAGYDPFRIVRGRLAQLERNGHAIDKVDVVVQGGTFPAREPAYQDWFVAGIYAGLNAGPEPEPPGTRSPRNGAEPSGPSAPSARSAWDPESGWAVLPEAERSRRLAALMRENESARCRAIGLTVETKPDWCLEEHLDRMLAQGATRVEIGLQALDDAVLAATHRGHTLEDSRRAMRLARDAGFKVCVHMMPGLPRPRNRDSGDFEEAASPASPRSLSGRRGPLDPDPAADLEDFRRLFAEEDWRPDMLKVYPTLVVQEGETLLKRQWREGLYHPYDSAAAAALVGEAKGLVPEWCRIQRIDRDIPTTHVEAGVQNSNLRQMAQAWREAQGLRPCACIRCREPARRTGISEDRLRLVRRDYGAGGGLEAFLALEDPEADAVVAFLRLRRAGPLAHRPEMRAPGGAAVVRELKVYGTATRIGDDPEEGSWQHRGLGASLLAEAERVAFSEWGAGRLLVIAGPGVKPYYRRHGYADLGPYVAKSRQDRQGAPAPQA